MGTKQKKTVETVETVPVTVTVETRGEELAADIGSMADLLGKAIELGNLELSTLAKIGATPEEESAARANMSAIVRDTATAIDNTLDMGKEYSAWLAEQEAEKARNEAETELVAAKPDATPEEIAAVRDGIKASGNFSYTSYSRVGEILFPDSMSLDGAFRRVEEFVRFMRDCHVAGSDLTIGDCGKFPRAAVELMHAVSGVAKPKPVKAQSARKTTTDNIVKVMRSMLDGGAFKSAQAVADTLKGAFRDSELEAALLIVNKR